MTAGEPGGATGGTAGGGDADFRHLEKVVEIAKRAVQGDGRAERLLDDPDAPLLDQLWNDPRLVDTPEDAALFAYLVALLRQSGRTRAYERALDVAAGRITSGGVPREARGTVYARLALVLTEGGRHDTARSALRAGLAYARDGRERAQGHALLAVLEAQREEWRTAARHAHEAATHADAVPDGRERLEVRMRATSVRFQSAQAVYDRPAARELADELESVCQALIDAWGSTHPRALAALVTMASARQESAVYDGDSESVERLVHVLTVAAQRASVTLGARHPQTHAVREELAAAERRAAAWRTARTLIRTGAMGEPRGTEALEPALRLAPAPPEPLRALSLELIVHGLVNTDPAEMLGDTRVEQTQGDATAGIHRRAEDVGAEERARGRRQGRPDSVSEAVPESVSEAYTWSNSVTGSRSRVLWMVLLPFTLVNLAHWTRPAAEPGARRAVRLHGVLVRVLALSLTALAVAAVCAAAMDIVAWQCAGTPACTEDRPWLAFMAAGPGGSGGWWSRPGTRLVVAALIPAGLLALVWWLARRTWYAYESQRPLPGPVDEDDPEPGQPLALPGFWYSTRLVARLRAAHTALGTAVVAGFLVAAPLRHDRSTPGTDGGVEVFGSLIAVLTVSCAVLALSVVVRRGRAESLLDLRTDRAVTRFLPSAGVLTLLLAAAYALCPHPGWESSGRLPGGEGFGALALVQVYCVIALAVLGIAFHRRRREPRTALRGLAPAAAGMLACGMAWTLGAGAAQGVTDWLFGRGAFGGRGLALPGPAPQLIWTVATIPPLVAFVLVFQGVLSARLWSRARRAEPVVDGIYPGSVPDRTRSRRIAQALSRASRLDMAPGLLGAAAVVSYLLVTASVVGAQMVRKSPEDVGDPFRTAQALGSWLIALGFVLFLNRGRLAYRDPSSPGALGVLWDVGTFWPRAAHPFAPPCYAERAVPDLTWRVRTLLDEAGPEGRVVVSGHSQGSVLTAAALFQLGHGARRQVTFLTYGSPLERIYGRWFPAYFGGHALDGLHHGLARWRNLWRSTDPVGGPVRVKGADRGPLRDPLVYERTPEHPLPQPIRAHGGYRSDPAFAEERARLMAPPPGNRII